MAQGLKTLCLSCFAVGALSASAAAQSNDLINRLDRLENEINTLNRAVYKGETPPPGAFSGGADTANLEVRLQQLETQMRELTGRIEQQDHAIRQIENQMQGMNAASRDAAAVRNNMPIEQPPLHDMRGQPADLMQGEGVGAASDLGYRDDSALPQPGLSDTGAQRMEQEVAVQGMRTAVPTASNDAAGQYEQAFAYLKSGDYGAAEQGFDAFLKKYPDHALSANAIYWLGESHYVRAEYDKAAKVFAQAYQKYPGGPKGADNLLKLGMSLAGAGKKKDACVALGQLAREYPNGPGPILRRGEQEMSNLDCR